MKTSSSTFEPKQSDCNYYYSPDCGLVVCTETDKSETTDLNALVVSGKDAKGKELGPQTQWINITEETTTGNNVSVDMSTVDSALTNNDWTTIQAVIQAGKVAEAGWKTGDLTPSFTINGSTNQARIVDIDNDKVTFMLTTSIGNHNMNDASVDYPYGDNIGGYADSEMKTWLDTTVYNSLDADFKAVISQTTIICNDGSNNPNNTKSVSCYLFLPSVNEVCLADSAFIQYPNVSKTVIEAEGTPFDYFANDEHSKNIAFWLRTSRSDLNERFFAYCYGDCLNDDSLYDMPTFPFFTIS